MFLNLLLYTFHQFQRLLEILPPKKKKSLLHIIQKQWHFDVIINTIYGFFNFENQSKPSPENTILVIEETFHGHDLKYKADSVVGHYYYTYKELHKM